MRQFRIVLVRPQIPENVGFIARSMKAFGQRDLVLVSPVFKFDPASPAYKTASGAADILAGARCVPSLWDAVVDCHEVAGFSRRTHDFHRPQPDLMEWSESLQAVNPAGHKTALVFGPEDFGLCNEDKHLCHVLVRIPLEAETLSLNLAHAITVVLYELTRSQFVPAYESQPADEISGDALPATQKDLCRALDALVEILDRTAFFKTGRRERQIESLRMLLQQMGISQSQFPTVMGVLNAILTRDRA